jgi:hypothetical protein
VSFCPKVSLSASAIKTAVAARVHRQGGQPRETVSSCLDKWAMGQCKEPSSWVKTPTTVSSLLCTCREKGFITSGKPRAGAFVSALLISLKALSNDPSKGQPTPKAGQSISQKVLNLPGVSWTP